MTTINKVIWITGASSGIGEALAHALVAKNCRLIISARNEAALQAIKANYPAAQIEVVPFDLLDFDATPAVVAKAISFFGKIDVLVNNGGISQRSLIAETDFAVDKKIMDGRISLTIWAIINACFFCRSLPGSPTLRPSSEEGGQ